LSDSCEESIKYQSAINSKLRRALLASDHVALRQAISATENLNQADHTSMTPLLYAVYRGDVESVKLLLEGGADPNFNPTPSDPSHTPFGMRNMISN
jgi:ankyrin repeat protein